ncbi:MAG: TMEM143 family protein, partial [Candidatus Poseidoniaceae archaeon]
PNDNNQNHVTLIVRMGSDLRQHYIPISRSKVKEELFQLEGMTDELSEGLGKISQMLEVIWHHSSHAQLEKLKNLYESMDPDGIGAPDSVGKEGFLETLRDTLHKGNWKEISPEEMDAAHEGENVFPISLDVRLDELVTSHLFKLGETSHPEVRTSLFGLKKEEIIVEAFDRVIQVLQYHDEDWFEDKKRMKHYPGEVAAGLHLRLFKTVPKLDLETVFPNASPEMRIVDKVKIMAPLMGGLFTLAIKFGPLLIGGNSGSTSTSIIGGICVAFGTYVLKSYMSYQKTRDKYQSQISRNLYFKGQANNAAVLNMVIDMAEEQEVKEALLAYTFLLVDQKNHDYDSLDQRIEQWLLDTFDVDVGFEIEDAIRKLGDMKLLSKKDDGSLVVLPIKESLKILDNYWDQIYGY